MCLLWRTKLFTFHLGLLLLVVKGNPTILTGFFLSKIVKSKINQGPNFNIFFMLLVRVQNRIKK